MARIIAFCLCMIALGTLFGVGVGSYIREQIIFKECNLKGEYQGFDDEVYITCDMED